MRRRRESQERKWLGSRSLEAREGRRAIWVARVKGHSHSQSADTSQGSRSGTNPELTFLEDLLTRKLCPTRRPNVLCENRGPGKGGGGGRGRKKPHAPSDKTREASWAFGRSYLSAFFSFILCVGTGTCGLQGWARLGFRVSQRR